VEEGPSVEARWCGWRAAAEVGGRAAGEKELEAAAAAEVAGGGRSRGSRGSGRGGSHGERGRGGGGGGGGGAHSQGNGGRAARGRGRGRGRGRRGSVADSVALSGAAAVGHAATDAHGRGRKDNGAATGGHNGGHKLPI
jgi:hypothetical protein